MYTAVVRPILTYAAETRTDTVTTKQILQTAEMQTPRKISRIRRQDDVPGEEIRQQCNIEDIGCWLPRRRNEWNEHINRILEDRLVKIVRDNRPTGKRSPGR